MKSIIRIIPIIALAILFVASFTFVFWIAKYSFPKGDDVCLTTVNGHRYYVDEFRDNIVFESKIDSIPEFFENFKNIYTEHSGRIIPISMMTVLPWFGQTISAFFTAVFFIGIIGIVTCVLCCKACKRECAALFSLLNFLFLLYYFSKIDYALMWTSTVHHIMPVFLLYLYYILAVGLFFNKKREIKLYEIILINLLGLIAGATNEAVVPTFGILFFVYMIINSNKMSYSYFKTILLNLGLFVGAFFSIAAPGNFSRMNQAHDIENFSRPYSEKLLGSFYVHVGTILSNNHTVMYCILAIIGLIDVCIFIISKDKMKMLHKVLPYAVAFVGSIFVWGFSSYVPAYGMLAPLSFFYIVLFTPLVYGIGYLSNRWKIQVNLIQSVVVIASVCYLIMINVGWMKDLRDTRVIWDKAIAESEPGSIIEVPEFPESCNNIYTMYNDVNNLGDIQIKYETNYFDRTIVRIKQ